VFGGTFNPPHLGHLICAEAAADALGLDRVLLVPAAAPPHKDVPGDPGPDIRMHLTRLAAAGNPRLEVSDIELRRQGPSYTVDTLRELAEREPAARPVLIMGGDMALGFAGWREPEVIAGLARFAVVERENIDRSAIAGALMRFPGADVKLFSMPRCDISSTLIRARVAEGRSVRYLVPDVVGEEIERRGLYRLV
jgi:nicotinate-nucleotide adenylyltransferase